MDHDALRQHLCSLLGPLPADVDRLVGQARPRQVPAGTALLSAGQPWRSLWWVSQGAFRMYYLDRKGQASNKNFYLDGALIWPITPQLAQAPVGFWVEALEPSEVWSLPWPEWQAASTGWDAWDRFERRTLALLLQDKMSREQQFLQCSATERYQHLLATHPTWVNRLPLRHLASWLGITDVALSRIRRRLNPG